VFTERSLLIIIEELNNDLTHCEENEPLELGKSVPVFPVSVPRSWCIIRWSLSHELSDSFQRAGSAQHTDIKAIVLSCYN